MTAPTDIRDDARRIHDDAILIDGQGVTVLLPVAQIVPGAIDGVPWLERAIAGGVTAQNVTLGIGGIGMGTDDFRALIGTMHGHYCYFEIEPRLILVETADDIRRAKRENRLGVIFGVQGLATKIEDDPTLVRILHRLGLRIGQLMYNERSSLGCGCLEQPDTGLTQLGKIVVREMNHVGIGSDFFESESAVRFHAFFRVRYPEVFGDYRLDNVYFDDFNRVDHFPLLTEALIDRGFSPEETTKILGGNFMRVFDCVWRA